MEGKLIILGLARGGKDSLAEFYRDNFNFNFESSSMAAAREFIFDKLKDSHGYKTIEQCFTDRVNHRALWKSLIDEYNRDDPTRLAKVILKDNDCYVGMRSQRELKHSIDTNLFSNYILVKGRLDNEGIDSCDIDFDWLLSQPNINIYVLDNSRDWNQLVLFQDEGTTERDNFEAQANKIANFIKLVNN